MLHPSHFDDKLNTSNFIAEINIVHSVHKRYKELNISKRKRITIHPTQGSYPRIASKNEHRYPAHLNSNQYEITNEPTYCREHATLKLRSACSANHGVLLPRQRVLQD